jgi:predicted ATPase
VREQPGRTLMESISDHLGSEDVLLLLDNCEHLVDACARSVEELLLACPNLRVIATSREALRIAGERAWRVPSLSLPDPGLVATAERLDRYESVRLFVERTKDVVADFELNDRNAPAVAGVCRRLDGLPLAIELAAARTGMLSPQQILSRLDDRFALLTAGGRTAPSRHRTLLATMDWSHNLLSEEEKILFRRLSVFVGGFTLEAAEAVCSGGDVEEVLEPLSHLLDKSLVVAREEHGAAVPTAGDDPTVRSWEARRVGRGKDRATRARPLLPAVRRGVRAGDQRSRARPVPETVGGRARQLACGAG